MWFDPQPAGEWISEGDTTNMLNLLGNGLRGHEHPSYGGWGGRAARTAEGPDTWSIAESRDEAPDETVPDETVPDEYSVTRWFADAQRDFATRLRWSVTSEFSAANHHPVVTLSPGLDLSAAPGQRVTLRSNAEDPDGNAVTLRWWQYREAGTLPAAVRLDGADAAKVAFTLPDDAVRGQTVHLILEARDDAELPLATYRRVIVTVA